MLKDMEEELVYKITKAIIENIDCISKIYAPVKDLTPEWMASELGRCY